MLSAAVFARKMLSLCLFGLGVAMMEAKRKEFGGNP
jgi:hypothetical protein